MNKRQGYCRDEPQALYYRQGRETRVKQHACASMCSTCISQSIQGHSPAAAEKSLFMLWRTASEAAGSAFFFAGASASPACKGKLGVGVVYIQ